MTLTQKSILHHVIQASVKIIAIFAILFLAWALIQAKPVTYDKNLNNGCHPESYQLPPDRCWNPEYDYIYKAGESPKPSR